ncbi:hypothetical protein [Oscillibacter sp. GMB15532]|uniref:hypothetical protein n=1 Tax=Oscillibacter sp. GMB15532 TaxID=3230022 RepID=UPI0034DF3B68
MLEENPAERSWPLSADRNAFMGNLGDHYFFRLKLVAFFFLQCGKNSYSGAAAGMTRRDSTEKLLAPARSLHVIGQLFLMMSAAVKFHRIGVSVVTSAASSFPIVLPVTPGIHQPSFFVALILQQNVGSLLLFAISDRGPAAEKGYECEFHHHHCLVPFKEPRKYSSDRTFCLHRQIWSRLTGAACRPDSACLCYQAAPIHGGLFSEAGAKIFILLCGTAAIISAT